MRLPGHERRVLAESENVLQDSGPSLVLLFQRWPAATQPGAAAPSPTIGAPGHPQLAARARPPSALTDAAREEENPDGHGASRRQAQAGAWARAPRRCR